MVDFRFYLNKQGIRGAKGETGDSGFSPEIVVDTETVDEYKLRIINENNEIVTPNLRGNAIEILDPDGDIIKYNKNTKNFYVGTIDTATANSYGIVKLANSEDIASASNSSAITPANMSEAIAETIVSPDDSVHIFNNPETHKTELTVDNSSVTGLETRVEHLEDDALYLENAVNDLSTGLSNTNSNVSALNTSLNGVKSDLSTEAQMRLNADNQQQQAIDTERQQRETQDAALQAQLNNKLTVDNIKQGSNITITKDGNNVTISSTGGITEVSWGAIAGSIENQLDLKGQLDAIYDTIGDEVEAIDAMLDLKAEKANTYTKDEVNQIEADINAHIEAVEGEIPTIATPSVAGTVIPDGTTITIDSDGKISAVGGGSSIDVDNRTIYKNINNKISVVYPIEPAISQTDTPVGQLDNMKLPVDYNYGDQGKAYYSQVVMEDNYGQHVNPLVSFDTIEAGDNIEIVKNTNTGKITFNSTGGSDSSFAAGEGIKFTKERSGYPYSLDFEQITEYFEYLPQDRIDIIDHIPNLITEDLYVSFELRGVPQGNIKLNFGTDEPQGFDGILFNTQWQDVWGQFHIRFRRD